MPRRCSLAFQGLHGSVSPFLPLRRESHGLPPMCHGMLCPPALLHKALCLELLPPPRVCPAGRRQALCRSRSCHFSVLRHSAVPGMVGALHLPHRIRNECHPPQSLLISTATSSTGVPLGWPSPLPAWSPVLRVLVSDCFLGVSLWKGGPSSQHCLAGRLSRGGLATSVCGSSGHLLLQPQGICVAKETEVWREKKNLPEVMESQNQTPWEIFL